jgi:hypothetical protein
MNHSKLQAVCTYHDVRIRENMKVFGQLNNSWVCGKMYEERSQTEGKREVYERK